MRFFSDTRVTVVPTGDTVIMLGTSIATRIYLSDSRFPIKPSGDTVVALGYQWRHQEIP